MSTGSAPLVHQIRVDKVLVAHLVVGDVMNVLRDVAINFPQPFGVGPIPMSTRHLAVLDSAQFVILSVKVSLECLSRGEKSQDGGITFSETPTRGRPLAHRTREQPAPHGCCAAKCQSGLQKTAAVPRVAHHVVIGLHVVPPFRHFDVALLHCRNKTTDERGKELDVGIADTFVSMRNREAERLTATA
jgi:Archaeal/vacuolar-type H+-ATPase subunit A